MSAIGGPGGIGGPKGPGAPKGPEGLDDIGEVADLGPAGDAGAVEATARAAPTRELDAIAADLAAGRLTPQEAVDKLVEQIANGTALDAADRAELRALMTDLVANDPHLGALINRL